ncbi:hypothetical protein EO244_11420 [Ancylomarina salipaludis]|uniref:Transposase n=1 Tax=Ancylomarina salipaludis TaxID=2501299 RepID=A0A4Q1JJS4_9BACT|nr:transposase [Ancylomarina salipaludis]RXQ92153.1 hypothetical protein EO244_11420 [Ancylomarina salipaludis]
MEKFGGKYRIESNRAKFWDYSSPADYFITICVSGRECILGDIIDGEMILSEYGKIVETEIKKIPEYHKRVIMNVWTVMPNHIHLLVSLGDYAFDNGLSTIDNDTVKKIHEFSLQASPQLPQQRWWINPKYQPNINEIKQYRKERRRMLIPKILGKFK